MPQVVAAAFVVAGLYVGYKWLQRQAKASASQKGAPNKASSDTSPIDQGNLTYDAVQGVYRPKRKD